MAGWTNRGKMRILDAFFRKQNVPNNYYVALFTSATSPTVDTNTFSQLTQIATGNGYSDGGYQLTSGSADFDYITEDDSGDKAIIRLKDITWTASGGNIPSSGAGARWACLTDDNATIANRDILCFWDLIADRSCSSTQSITLQDCEIDALE